MALMSYKQGQTLVIMVFVLDITILSVVLVILRGMEEKHEIKLEKYLEQKCQAPMKETRAKLKADMKQLRPEIKRYITDLNLKPVAHLIGSRQKKMKEETQETNVTVTDWITGNNGFIEHGIMYRNGRLVVPIDGLYHIYGMLDIHEEYGNGQYVPKRTSSIEMRVYRYNILRRNQEEMLCTCLANKKPANNQFFIFRSFLSADIYLKAGDEVYIKVSNISFLQNPSRNVFGINMI